MKAVYAVAAAVALAALGVPGIGPASGPAWAEASTIRIETRAFYGATVTLEEGVRVFRPLPPHSRVVINPGGRTPLHLSIEDGPAAAHNTAKASATGGSVSNEAAGIAGGGFGQGRPHRKSAGAVGRVFGGKPAGHGPAHGQPR